MRDKHLPFGPGASSFLGVHGPGKHLSLGVRAPGWLQSPRMPGSLRSTVGVNPRAATRVTGEAHQRCSVASRGAMWLPIVVLTNHSG